MADVPRTVEAEINLETPYDASDVEQVTTKRKKMGREERARLEFVEGMMTLAQGRKYIWQFLERCHIHSNPFVVGDMHATAFQLGEQNVGKIMLQDVMQFPDLYVKMVKEAKEY